MHELPPDPPSPAPLDEAPAPAPAPPHPRKSAVLFFVTLFGFYLTLGASAQRLSPAAGLAWSQLFALLLPAAAAAAGSNLQPARALLVARRPTRAQLRLAVAIGVAGFFAATAISSLNSLLLPAEWLARFDVSQIFAQSWPTRVALALAAVVLAPVCEELAFRGYLLTAARTRFRPAAAIAISGLLFAFMHLNPVLFMGLAGLGAVFGWLTWRAGSVWPAVAAHAANNALGAALALTAGRAGAARQHPEPGVLDVLRIHLPAVALSGAVLASLFAAYRRATPEPPPIEDAVAPADPGDPSTRFRLRRLSRRYRLAAAAGFLSLLALALAARR